MISQSGNVAVNALGSRRGIRWHTMVSTGNQAVLDASDWLAAICELDGVRSVAMFLESDGDGAAPRRGARSLCRARDRRRGAQGRRLAAGRERRRGAHRRAGRRPARLSRPGRGGRRRLGPRPPRAARAGPRRWPSPGRGPAATGRLAVLTCSGGDSGVAADEAERLGRRARDASARPTAERLADAAAGGGDGRQPARLHGADLGRVRAPARGSWSPSAPTRRSTSCCCSTTTPRASRRRRRTRGPRSARPIVAGAIEADAAALVASTLPDLIDDAASRELADRGVPAIAGPAQRARLRARAAPAARRSRPRCARSPPRRRAAGRPDGRAWIGEAEAKELLRAGGVAVPDGRLAADADDAVAAAHEVGWPVALKLSAPVAAAQERGRRAGARARRRGRGARGRRAAARRSASPRRRGPGRAHVAGRSRGLRRRPHRRGRPGAGDRARRDLGRGLRRRRDRPAAGRRRADRARAARPARRPAADRRPRLGRGRPGGAGGARGAGRRAGCSTAASRCSSSTRSRPTPTARSPSTRSPGRMMPSRDRDASGSSAPASWARGSPSRWPAPASPPRVHEPDAEPLERSRERVEQLGRAGGRGRQARRRRGRVADRGDRAGRPSSSDLADCDLVVEAVTEDPDGQGGGLRRARPAAARRTRSSPPTPPRSRSPSSPRRPGGASG